MNTCVLAMNDANLLTVKHFLYALQGMFQLFVNIIEVDPVFNDLIANIFIDMVLNPSESFTSMGTYGTGSGGSITLQFKVTCHTNFYGPNCTTFCIDTDDNTGHFTCGSNGEKLCLTGWSEPSGNCLTRKLNMTQFQHLALINVTRVITVECCRVGTP